MEAGEKYNKWTFIEFVGYKDEENKKYPRSIFKCDCGTIAERYENDIKYGSSKSCGCTKWNEKIKLCIDCGIRIKNVSTRCQPCSGIMRRTPVELRKTILSMIIRNSDEYKEWRKAVFERDFYTCQISGKKGKDLVVHHIIGFADIIREYNIDIYNWHKSKELFDVSNGITLNKTIHNKFHSKYGKTGFTKQNLLEMALIS